MTDSSKDREYVVTIMVPTVIRVKAQSLAQAKIAAWKSVDNGERITKAEELGGGQDE